jgi:hypothetical protein
MNASRLSHHDIAGAVLQNRGYIRVDGHPGEQGVILLVMDLAPAEIGDRIFKRKKPYAIFRIHEYIQDLVIRQAVAGGKVAEVSAVKPADARLGAKPHKAILVLGHAINGGPYQPVIDIIMHVAVFLGGKGSGGTNEYKDLQTQQSEYPMEISSHTAIQTKYKKIFPNRGLWKVKIRDISLNPGFHIRKFNETCYFHHNASL